MRGTERIRKKHLTSAGWRVVEDEHVEEGHRLVLRRETNETTELSSRTRPRAYLHAEHGLLKPQQWIRW